MNRIKLRSSRSVRAALVVPLAVGALSVVSTGVASAEACTHPAWSDKDKSGSGHGNSSSTPVRTGPNSSCGATATVGSGVILYYHCYVVNSVGNTWTNVRIDGTNIDGWVYDGNLNNGGSLSHC